MKKKKVDVAIIGAGTAGLNARREAEKAGRSFVLIEDGPYGTTCARVGCMPSKLLIAAADSAHGIRTAGTFGIDVDDDGWRIDGAAVMKRVQRERDRFAGFVIESTESIPEESRLRGRAVFTGPRTLVVDDATEVEFEAAVVATGSSTRIPEQLEKVRDDVLTNETIFELEELPASLAVFGTGVIGLELGQAFARLGVSVAFFNPFDQVGFLQDTVVAATARAIFRDELRLTLGVEIDPVVRSGNQYEVSWRGRDGTHHTATFDAVFSAAGRIPNLEGFGLEDAGVELDERGRLASWNPHTCRAGESRIYLAGDVTGFRPLLHEASDEGRLAGANAARHPDEQYGHRKVPLGIAFTDPNMGFVGQRVNEMDPNDTVCGEVRFENQGRSRVMAQNRGVLRVFANSNAELIGAEFIAPRGEHLAHLLAWSCQSKRTIPQMLAYPFYHPTVEEGLRTALRNAAKRLKMGERCPPEDRGMTPAG